MTHAAYDEMSMHTAYNERSMHSGVVNKTLQQLAGIGVSIFTCCRG